MIDIQVAANVLQEVIDQDGIDYSEDEIVALQYAIKLVQLNRFIFPHKLDEKIDTLEDRRRFLLEHRVWLNGMLANTGPEDVITREQFEHRLKDVETQLRELPEVRASE